MIVLSAPTTYTQLTAEEKKAICNGCGAKGGIPVPNTFYGLDIREACNIHDFRYFMGETWVDKEWADEEFHQNLDVIIEHETWFKWLVTLRKTRANIYVAVVKAWGDKAYMAGKGIKPRSDV